MALSESRFDDALDLFRRSRSLSEEGDETSIRGEAFALLGLGRIDEARPLFEGLLESIPDDEELRQGLERILAEQAEAALALRRLELKGLMAESRRRGDEEALLVAARELMALDPADSSAPTELGRLSLSRGRLDEAERFFRLAVERDDKNDEARAGLSRVSEQRRALRLAQARRLGAEGISLAKSGQDGARARSLLQEALRLDPDLEDVLFPLARALEEEGNLAEAEGHYRALLLRAPEKDEAWNNLGLLLYRRGEGGEAETLLSTGLQRAPMSRVLARNLALLLAREGRGEKALDSFRHYFKLDPYDDGERWGEERLRLLPPAKARPQCDFDGYLAALTESPLPVALPLDERRASLQPLAAALAESPAEADVYFGYLLSLGASKPVVENPDPWRVGLSLVSAHSHLAQGRFYDAFHLLEDLLPSEREEDPAVSMLLGHALLHLRRYSEARESYRYAFLQAPGDPIVRESLKRLLEAYASRTNNL